MEKSSTINYQLNGGHLSITDARLVKVGVKMTTKELKNLEAQRTPCEIYSRIVGYIRPISQWNDGKQAEYEDRKEFVVSDGGC